jgi:hypothetical protein
MEEDDLAKDQIDVVSDILKSSFYFPKEKNEI